MIGFLLAVLLLAAVLAVAGVVLVQLFGHPAASRIDQIDADVQAVDAQIEAMTRQSLQRMRQVAREQQRAARPPRPPR